MSSVSLGMRNDSNGRGRGQVSHFNFAVPIISLECVKLGISVLVYRLIMTSTNASFINYSEGMNSESRDLFKFGSN